MPRTMGERHDTRPIDADMIPPFPMAAPARLRWREDGDRWR